MQDPHISVLNRRLLPMYVATFFHGFVFWHVIQKLFMQQIGFDDAGIAFAVASYSALMLVCETPSGILADRWSRKGVLIVASVVLMLCSLIGGISTEPMLYMVSILLWGVFFSLYSGTYDSIIYDTVKEITGSGDLFDKYFGRFRAIDSVALISGALVGGMIGQVFGLSAPFFFTIILGLGAIIALSRLEEPQLHKEGRHDSIAAHIAETFRVLLWRPQLLPLVALIVMLIVATIMFYEFNQLWLIALQVPPAWMGPAVSGSLAASGVAGYFIGRRRHANRQSRLVLHAALIVSGFTLIFVPIALVIAAAHFVFAVSVVALTILAMRDLHDILPSRVRSGSASALSSLARIIVIPVSLFFGMVSANSGIFTAAWVFAGLTLIILACELARPRPV